MKDIHNIIACNRDFPRTWCAQQSTVTIHGNLARSSSRMALASPAASVQYATTTVDKYCVQYSTSANTISKRFRAVLATAVMSKTLSSQG